MEKILLNLARYGEPYVLLVEQTWVCSLEMRVLLSGVTFKIRARGDSPQAAVLKCQQDMYKAIEDLTTVGKISTAEFRQIPK